MVAAYHLIWTVYGWWLPNDPRGSNSHLISSDVIAELGELHYGRKKIQPSSRIIREFYEEAKSLLRHELRTFTEPEIVLLGIAFAEVVKSRRYTCYGCALMPDHVHLVIRKHRDQAEEMLEHFQTVSRHAILDGQYREATHPVWGGPGWKVFLETREDIERTIRYVEQNPAKAKRAPQTWDFVKPYEGWLPGGNLY